MAGTHTSDENYQAEGDVAEEESGPIPETNVNQSLNSSTLDVVPPTPINSINAGHRTSGGTVPITEESNQVQALNESGHGNTVPEHHASCSTGAINEENPELYESVPGEPECRRTRTEETAGSSTIGIRPIYSETDSTPTGKSIPSTIAPVTMCRAMASDGPGREAASTDDSDTSDEEAIPKNRNVSLPRVVRGRPVCRGLQGSRTCSGFSPTSLTQQATGGKKHRTGIPSSTASDINIPSSSSTSSSSRSGGTISPPTPQERWIGGIDPMRGRSRKRRAMDQHSDVQAPGQASGRKKQRTDIPSGTARDIPSSSSTPSLSRSGGTISPPVSPVRPNRVRGEHVENFVRANGRNVGRVPQDRCVRCGRTVPDCHVCPFMDYRTMVPPGNMDGMDAELSEIITRLGRLHL